MRLAELLGGLLNALSAAPERRALGRALFRAACCLRHLVQWQSCSCPAGPAALLLGPDLARFLLVGAPGALQLASAQVDLNTGAESPEERATEPLLLLTAILCEAAAAALRQCRRQPGMLSEQVVVRGVEAWTEVVGWGEALPLPAHCAAAGGLSLRGRLAVRRAAA